MRFNAEDYQRRNVWAMIALDGNDQLRQRMAWALSQLIVVTPLQISREDYTEIYLNYYDIFVRHAFGSYFDILKEVVSLCDIKPALKLYHSFIGGSNHQFCYVL
jgi:uncharacterized protein (DUF1800 family)